MEELVPNMEPEASDLIKVALNDFRSNNNAIVCLLVFFSIVLPWQVTSEINDLKFSFVSERAIRKLVSN